MGNTKHYIVTLSIVPLVNIAVVLVKGGKSTAVLEILKSDGKKYILPLWTDTVCYV